MQAHFKVLFVFSIFNLVLMVLPVVYSQTGKIMVPISGADGEFDIVSIGNHQVYRTHETEGSFQGYMYFQTPENVNDLTAYVEVHYLDYGFGSIGLQYNSASSDYQAVAERYGNYSQDKHIEKVAVYKLPHADFRNAQNLAADLRLSSDFSFQMHIIEVRWFAEATPLFIQYTSEDWFSPYHGQVYTGDKYVDATTLTGKIICGYQGWFRTAGDPTGNGWIHYNRGNFNEMTVDLWPDMEEYSELEKYPVPGWTTQSGKPATLFSSANKRTVLRHFQWMETYGIDGAAVQRFAVAIDPQKSRESYRILGYSREAAQRTGRTYYVMYDISGDTTGIVNLLRDDWKYLMDSMKVTENDRYLRQGGLPVVGLFGFYGERFSANLANEILDIFQLPGKYQAFLSCSGQWPWRAETRPGWRNAYLRMNAYIPWNIGNYLDPAQNDGKIIARTATWAPDKQTFDSAGVMFIPLINPGFSWDNLMNQSPGTTNTPRRHGEFMWEQIVAAKNLGVQSIFIAMFDEIDEGTAIFKVTNDVPVNHYFLDLEGLPSDFYLLLTGTATRMFRDEIPLTDTVPDFANMSQPPIPDVLFPRNEDTLGTEVNISWTEVTHPAGISGYTLDLDTEIYQVQSLHQVFCLSEGQHTIKVRAVNGLDNPGGWSETTTFNVKEKIYSYSDTLCKGETFVFGNLVIDHSGTYSQAFSSVNQCDSLVNAYIQFDSINTNILTDGSTLTAEAASSSFQWIDCLGQIIIPGEFSESFTAGTSGDYAVIINTNGCRDTSECIHVIITGFDSRNPDQLKTLIYPNPTSGLFRISNPIVLAGRTRLSLIDRLGKCVRSWEIESANLPGYEVDISNLNNGIYYLQIQYRDSGYTYPLIKTIPVNR